MGKKCLKCGYERKDSDLAPDYECPKCGAVYSKVKILEKKETSAVQTSKKVNESPERDFLSYFRRYKQVFFVSLILIAISFFCYYRFFSSPDLYYRSQDGSINPADRTLDEFIANLKKAYEFESYESLTGGGGKLVAGSNRPVYMTESFSLASPGRFTIWFKKVKGVHGLVAYKVIFAPAPVKSIIGQYKDIPARRIDNSVVKGLYPDFFLKLMGEFPSLQQKRIHCRLIGTSEIEPGEIENHEELEEQKQKEKRESMRSKMEMNALQAECRRGNKYACEVLKDWQEAGNRGNSRVNPQAELARWDGWARMIRASAMNINPGESITLESFDGGFVEITRENVGKIIEEARPEAH